MRGFVKRVPRDSEALRDAARELPGSVGERVTGGPARIVEDGRGSS
jgi:hypothetical protein